MPTIAYSIRKSLYLNITNRCSNDCSFCIKFNSRTFIENDLFLDREPSFEEIMAAIAEFRDFEEVVFCGYGESLMRLEFVKLVAEAVKKYYGTRVRINTDGQANLVHGRNIIPELAGIVDCLSVSLNASDAETYIQLCHTPFGAAGFTGVCDFIRLAAKEIPEVIASVVLVPSIDVDACKALALSLGASFRVRSYYKG
ncbi:MAG: radical SAM protein [Chlorobiaceae bacterium]|nr:radical SAM protein [Chlorobiaceae bacterium]NTV15949.1 radical SAM protein [Chlorobiaceae bacterium]